jgi:hypothetical protein
MKKITMLAVALLISTNAMADNSQKVAASIVKSVNKYISDTKAHYESGGDFFGSPSLENSYLSRMSTGSGCSNGECELNITSPDISNEMCSQIEKLAGSKVIFCKNGHLDMKTPKMSSNF